MKPSSSFVYFDSFKSSLPTCVQRSMLTINNVYNLYEMEEIQVRLGQTVYRKTLVTYLGIRKFLKDDAYEFKFVHSVDIKLSGNERVLRSSKDPAVWFVRKVT